MNNVNLIGRLTKDPELRTSRSGAATLKFTLAVDRRFKQQGQPDADFINCLAVSAAGAAEHSESVPAAS